MRSLKIKIVGRSIEIAWHQTEILRPMLPVIGMAHFHASNFGHCIGGVGLLQRTGHKIFLVNRLRAVTWIDAGRAEKQQLLDSVKVSLVDHVSLDENIFPDKLRGAG